MELPVGDIPSDSTTAETEEGTQEDLRSTDVSNSVEEQSVRGSELQSQLPTSGTSVAAMSLGGTRSTQTIASLSDSQTRDFLDTISSSCTQSGWDTTVDTSDPTAVHVHLTKTEIDSTAVGLGADIVVKPGRKTDKKQTPNRVQKLRETTERRMQDWTEGMVRTAGTQSVIEKILQGKTWLVVTGSPGEGKTTAAYLALKQLHGMGRQVYEVRTPEEYFKVKEVKGAIIMLNDILGSCQFNTGNLEMWRTVLNDIFEMHEHKAFGHDTSSEHCKTFVILVIRTSVLNTAIEHLEKFKDLFLNNESVVDLTHNLKLSKEEKYDIWNYHADVNKVNIDEKIVKDVLQMPLSHGFPHCCRLFASMYSKNKSLCMKSFFSKPIEFLNLKMTSLLEDPTVGPLLREMLKHDGWLNLDSIRDDEKRYQYKTVVEMYRGTYLSEEDSTVRFQHPSICDSAAFVVCLNDPLFVVRNCSLSFLNERVRFKDLVLQMETESLITVTIASKYKEAYIERLKTEISESNIFLALSHVSFHSDTFTERFMESLFSNSKSLLKSDFIVDLMHHKDIKSEQSLLFHSTVSKSEAILKYICKFVDLLPEDQTDCLFGICEYSSISGLAFLLNKYENIPLNVRNSRYDTPLLVASKKSSVKMLELLLEKDVDVMVRDEKGFCVLYYICSYGLKGGGKVVRMLTDKNRDFDRKSVKFKNGKTALNYASLGGHVDVITALLDKGADINMPGISGRTPLHYACLSGHVNAVITLLKRGGDVNQTNEVGCTPLHYACRGGLINALTALLDWGVDINKASNDGQTPLHYTCLRGHANVVTILTDRGADINQTDNKGRTAFDCAFLKGYADIMTFLVDRGMDINRTDINGKTPLHCACLKGYLNVITALIKRGADINHTDARRQTPLHYACLRGHTNVMTILIERGAEINKTDSNGVTPLHCLCERGHADLISVLIDKGVDINQTDSNGQTPLHYACLGGHLDVLTALTNKGIDVNWSGNDGKTPLHCACLKGYKNIVLALIEQGVDIKKTDSNGQTPLHYACLGGHTDIITILIDKGVDVNQTNNDGQTPSHCACLAGKDYAVTALTDHGADINKTDDKGATPFHYACREGHVDVIKSLVDKVLNINQTDRNGRSALHEACLAEKADAVKCLLQWGADTSRTDTTGNTPLACAFNKKNTDIINMILDQTSLD